MPYTGPFETPDPASTFLQPLRLPNYGLSPGSCGHSWIPGEKNMSRSSHLVWTTCAALGSGILFSFNGASAADPVQPKGLGDPGSLQSVRIEPNVDGKGFAIRGREARQQLFVTGIYSSGQLL